MTLGDVAGLIAAIAFVGLVGFLALPLIKLGKVFDNTAESVRELTDHAVPILDEASTTIGSTNAQLVKVDTMTTSAAEISQNLSALTALVSATIGMPLIKLAAFSHGVRRAWAGLRTPDDPGDRK